MNKMLINKPSCRQACFFVTEKKNENTQQKERTRLDSRLDLNRFVVCGDP
jgi:hypothetical protein